MKRFPIVLTVVALGAAGFAAASIAAGGHFVQMLTGTGDTVTTPTVTTPTVTTATTTPTTTEEQGGGSRRVTMCHHTGSKKHPFHTITVDQHAVKAHLRHHDTPGACPAVQPTTTAPTSSTQKEHGKSGDHGNGKGNGKSNEHHGKPIVAPVTPTPVAPTTTTTSGDDNDNSSQHGNSGDHGNGNGNGHGHGKP